MANNNWNVKIDMKYGGQPWSLDLTSGEAGLLTMMRTSYPLVEQQLREAADAPKGTLPSGLVDDVLALLRCLVFNRLEAYRGENVRIAKVG